MLVKKTTAAARTSTNVIPIHSFDRQLKELYARRSAVEDLIASLEDYERFRATHIRPDDRKTA